MKSQRWQPVVSVLVAVLGMLGCNAQETPGRDPAEGDDASAGDASRDATGPRDAGNDQRVVDAGRPDRGQVEPTPDAGIDASPADVGGPADAFEFDGSVDATMADAGGGPSCEVGVDVLNEAGAVLERTQCRVTGPTGTCAQLIECICEFISTPEDQEHCIWSLLGPRALVTLGDFCNDGRDLATVLAIEEWQGNGPQNIRVRAEPECAAVPAN